MQVFCNKIVVGAVFLCHNSIQQVCILMNWVLRSDGRFVEIDVAGVVYETVDFTV